MAHPKLRVLFGSDDNQVPESEPLSLPLRNMASVTLSEIIGPLTDAVNSRRNWVEDFGEDEVLISADLHAVLQAYTRYQREAA